MPTKKTTNKKTSKKKAPKLRAVKDCEIRYHSFNQIPDEDVDGKQIWTFVKGEKGTEGHFYGGHPDVNANTWCAEHHHKDLSVDVYIMPPLIRNAMDNLILNGRKVLQGELRNLLGFVTVKNDKK